MEQAGHECVGWVEWDKFARKSYQAIHTPEGEFTEKDINDVKAELLPKSDCWCFGFPCQDISVAGKQGGFTNGKRSSLFFKVTGLIRELKEEDKPSYLFIENVKNLLSINKGWDFAKLLIEMDEIGYDVEWDVLDSAEVVPQHRERIFIVGHLRGRRTRKVFPITRKGGSIDSQKRKIVRVFDGRNSGTYGSQAEAVAGDSVNFSQPNSKTRRGRVGSQRANTLETSLNQGVVVPVLMPDRLAKCQNGRRFKTNGEQMFTLTAQDSHGVAIIQKPRGYNTGGEHEIAPTISVSCWHENNLLKIGGVYTNVSAEFNRGVLPGFSRSIKAEKHDAGVTDGYRIRKLTPRECWRLQGFPDWAFDKAQAVNSNSQLYKQAGNSVTVPVIYEIAKKLKLQ